MARGLRLEVRCGLPPAVCVPLAHLCGPHARHLGSLLEAQVLHFAHLGGRGVSRERQPWDPGNRPRDVSPLC